MMDSSLADIWWAAKLTESQLVRVVLLTPIGTIPVGSVWWMSPSSAADYTADHTTPMVDQK